MIDMPLSALAALLKPFVKVVVPRARQLHAERQAAQGPFQHPPDFMDHSLNNTLNRLRGGNIDDNWWSKLLSQVGQQYIAPEFLKTPALQKWLAEEHVADDLKVLATAQIMTNASNDAETRARLAQSYSNRTGEPHQLANLPIDVVAAILVAGYITSISSDQRPLAGMIQTLSGSIAKLKGIIPQTSFDPITQRSHTEKAEQELDEILMLRIFYPLRARRNIQELQGRVGDEGDLAAANNSAKNKVRYWTARLCASDNEMLALAKHLRKELRQTDLDMELAIVDALFAEAEGDANEALRILRDHDDPDSRTVLFGVLIRSRGEHEALAWYADQIAPDGGQFFTAVGWRAWAVCMAKVGKWEEAAQRLLNFQSYWQEMPALALVEGVINAAMLLPDDHRETALKIVPNYQGVTPNLVAKAENYHSRAVTCFKFVEQRLANIADDDFARFISDWRLWIRLMDPNSTNRNVVRDEICQRMKEGAEAVNLMQFAWAFDILVDVEPLRVYLEQRKQLGGLNEHELRAEFLLSVRSMKPRDLVTYLDQHKTRLGKVVPLATVTIMHVDALAGVGQTERARALVVEHAADLGEAQLNRLNVMIDATKGNDPRKRLELLYRKTKDLIDLKNLVSHLKNVGDRAALRPLIRDLFDRERNVDNAKDLVNCFSGPSFFDYAAIIRFLEDNPDILEWSNDLRAAKARALFQAGRLQDSKEINDILLSQRTNQGDFHLGINIAIASGDWERVPAILDREWPRRASHDPETLMALAQLAGQHGQNFNRALQLAKLAAEKALDDPRILAAAYWLHFQLGRDDEAEPNWLERATELSSTDEGPIRRVDLQDFVTWMPKRRDHLREVERKWLSGEIPTSVAAGSFNVSLARLLLYVPDQNTSKSDGRGRGILPIIAGERNPLKVQENWTIGLDVTSVMVLTYLGLLEESVSAFHQIKLAPDLMECLFRERDEIRFHQPSRITAAKRVLELRSKEQLRAADNLADPPKTIIEEVGLKLAALLQMARHDNGKVICVLPIHKVGSLMEQQADTSEYDDLILSTMDFCTLLRDEGKIDVSTYQRASLFLNKQGQQKRANLPPSILNGPIYIDQLALSYLQNANILQSMATTGLDIRIHPDVVEEMHALIEAGDVGNDLIDRIEGIRHILQGAVVSGTASFLPHADDQTERTQNHDIRFQATASLLAGSTACDALCIDDRFINSHPVLAVPPERSVPIVCVLDVLRYLVSRGCIGVVDHWTARHKLRAGGFTFVPLESDELVHWLKGAKVSNGQLTESVELRVLRQTMARIDSMELTNPKETIALSAGVPSACIGAIGSLWRDPSLTIEQATILSDWVWRHLWAAPLLGGQHGAAGAYTDWIRELLAMRLAHLLLPTAIQPHDRRAHYTNWIERSVLEPLRSANADIIEKSLTSVREAISALEKNPEAFGNRFLEQLPESARGAVISQDAEFARRCGFETRQIFRIGTDIKLVNSELFAATREVLATNKERAVQDNAGKEVAIGLDMEDQNIVVKWSGPTGVSHQATIPQLALLSPKRETRIAALLSLIERFGPTAPDFQVLLKNMETREANHQELSAIFNESANGVVALQASLIQKINSSGFSAIDVIPQSVSYFERFAGPAPDIRDPESYVREVLVPYRKELLRRNLRGGLDICCLGALREDLMPGQWVKAVDNDTLWGALSSCNAESNPFSLLGALDIALYRQGDHRFREFSANAVTTLLDEQLGQQDGPDIYGILQVFYDFVLNQINLLEKMSTYPGYWKRMCAWIQAGLIARALTRPSFSIEVDALQEWTLYNMTLAGAYARHLEARKEPMLFADLMTPQALRSEIHGRLHILKSRHESEGRQVPQSEDIDHALAWAEDRGQALALGFPGPLEGHRRPTKPIPQEVAEEHEDALTDSATAFPFQLLVMYSQIFALGKPELDRALQAVKTIAENNSDAAPHENLRLLVLASIVAAANRDTMLADGIADAVVSIVPRISKGKEIQMILRIMLQSAAAYEAHDAWFKWLEERLASIATHLPPPPNECLQMFRDHLDELKRVLPMKSWFHLRAKSIASAGAA